MTSAGDKEDVPGSCSGTEVMRGLLLVTLLAVLGGRAGASEAEAGGDTGDSPAPASPLSPAEFR